MLKRANCEWEVVIATSLDDWLKAIDNATLLVSGRFHHSIAAVCLNTPFITLNSNTSKVDGMLEVLGRGPSLKYHDPQLTDKLLQESSRVLSEASISVNPTDTLAKKAENNFSGLQKLALELQPSQQVETAQASWKGSIAGRKTDSRSR